MWSASMSHHEQSQPAGRFRIQIPGYVANALLPQMMN